MAPYLTSLSLNTKAPRPFRTSELLAQTQRQIPADPLFSHSHSDVWTGDLQGLSLPQGQHPESALYPLALLPADIFPCNNSALFDIILLQISCHGAPSTLLYLYTCPSNLMIIPQTCWKIKDKGKIHPRTGHEGPKREQMYSSTLSLTSALDRGGWSPPRPGRFTPRKETRYALYRRLGGPQGRSGRKRKISSLPEFDPRTVQPVAGRYTDWAIATLRIVNVFKHFHYCRNVIVFRAKCVNPLKPNDAYIGRTAPLTSRRCILYIYSTNIRTEYFKHAAHALFFSLQNAFYFIILSCLIPVLFAFYIQGVLKFKCKIPAPKG